MMDGLEYEYVNIGSWKTKVPSDICANREVFNEIFSTETWNKVLMPDQRERILNMLPPEVLQTIGAAQQTMEDLLARTLSRFGTNPLDTFFEQLEQGRFDPTVVQMRKALQKTWRKESIRKRKKYHSKLMQEVIVSRESHLRRLEFPPLADNCPTSSSLFSDIYSFEEPSLPSPNISSNPFSCTTVYTAKSQSPVKKLNCLESQVEKRYREEISSINHHTGCLSSSDDESPPKKSAKMSRKTLTKSVKGKSSAKGRGVANKMLKMNDSAMEVSPILQSSSTANTLMAKQPLLSQQQNNLPKNATSTSTTVVLSSTTLTTSPSANRGNRAEQTAVQMAKFPKILPAPLLTKLTTTMNQNSTTAAVATPPPPLLPSSSTSTLLNTLSSSTTSLHNMNQLTLTGTLLKTSLPSSATTVGTASTAAETTTSTGGITTLAAALSSPSPLSTTNIITPSSISSSSIITPSSSSGSSTMQFHSNPTKSSPILASQLQAPTQLLNNNSSNDHHRLNLNNINFPPHQSSLQKDPFNFPSIQNIKMRNCSEDESSSDDEFESIEPTIHLFATTPTTVNTTNTTTTKFTQKTNLSSSTKSLANNSAVNSAPSTITTPSRTIHSTNKLINDDGGNLMKTKTVLPVTTKTNVVNPTTSNITTFTTSKYTTVQLNKILQPQQSHLHPGQSTILLQQQQPQSQKVNVVKVITQSTANTNAIVSKTYSPKVSIVGGTPTNVVNVISTGSNPIISSSTLCTTSTSSNSLQPNLIVQTTQPNNVAIRTPKPLLAAVTTSTQQKIIPIQQSSTTTTTAATPLTTTKSAMLGSGRSIITFQAVGSTANNSLLNSNISTVAGAGITLNGSLRSGGLTSSTMTAATNLPTVNNNSPAIRLSTATSQSTTTTTSSSSSAVADYQMFNLLSQQNVNVMDALAADDLNLNLSLTMHHLDDEGIGDDDDVVDFVDGSKYSKIPDMEKIVDLSVLDGNPFDSIPNLSDELDVLDLDLVEGLCDFDGLLSEEKQYASFFSLIRDVLCSTRDHRMTLQVLEKTIRKWSMTPTAALNIWFLRVNDWNDALITALNFLAGHYQDAHPEDFVPYIEYKYKTKYYQWIGAGRDSDGNLTTLCQMWLENVDRLPPLKKLETENEDQEEEDDENEDSDGAGEEAKKKSKRPQTPPPPRCLTDWSVRPSTQEEKEHFQTQERNRFESPHKAFTYQMHGYESVVGPVKGVYSSQSGMTNKARGHSLLVDDRPPYVTILALVRDAVARLPNGEGTRSEICEMLRDSAFLAAEASNVTLNSVVSGALDRLHYERDPCVRYDSHKKSWVYLHRDRTQEQFERLHHNRSYTKSTKSRSNSSRKNRKQGSKSQSQSSSPGSSCGTTTTTIKDSTPPTTTPTTTTSTVVTPATPTMVTTTSTIVVSTPAPTITVVAKPSTVVAATTTTVSATTVAAASTTPTASFKQIFNVDNSQIVSSSTTPIAVSTGPRPNIRKIPLNEVQATASLAGSTIRFATVPNSTVVNGTANITNASSMTASQQTINPTAASLLNPHQTVAVQVQSVSTSGSGGPISGSTTVNKASIPGLTVSQGGTVTNTTVNPGQLILHPSALIRLANTLRLPEGVRFAQVKFPTTTTQQAAAPSNPVRLPQQRIILTRAAISGQAQTQVFSTPTGQTIILSTGGLGHLGGTTSQIPISITTSQGSSTIDTSNITFRTHPISSAASMSTSQNMHATPITVSSAGTLNVNRPAGTISIMSTGAHHGSNNIVVASGTQAQQHQHQLSVPTTTPTSTTLVVNNSNVISSTGATTTVLPLITQTQSGNVLQTVGSTQHLVSQVASQLQQQASQAAHSTATHQLNNSSPIIIRSQHGDLVIPSHMALGRGLPGYSVKVIPVQAGGKQTVSLARLVNQNTPTASQAQPLSSPANAQQP